MNARLYDPELGRFVSADPFIPNLLRSQAYNRYSYVYNSPLKYTDPCGYSPHDREIEEIVITGKRPAPWEGFEGFHDRYIYENELRDGSGSASTSAHSNTTIAEANSTLLQESRKLDPVVMAGEMTVYAKRGQPGMGQRLRPFNWFSYRTSGAYCFVISCAEAQFERSQPRWYSSERDAARAALDSANPLSIQHNIEFSGLIYKVAFLEKYSYTGRYTDWRRDTVDTTARRREVPWYARVVGEYHTHGAAVDFSPGRPGDLRNLGGYNNYSPEDIDRANTLNWNSYLGTPSAGYFRYSPSEREITALP